MILLGLTNHQLIFFSVDCHEADRTRYKKEMTQSVTCHDCLIIKRYIQGIFVKR